MKKLLSALLIVMLLCSVCMGSALADFSEQLQSFKDTSSKLEEEIARANLPTIDEVLAGMTADSGIVEVRDDLSDYDPDNFGEISYGQFKLIILERHLPEKEFTKYDSGYPDAYVDGLPDDFTGVDIGTSRIWVRCDLMNQLPKEVLASSLEDADILIIGETQYFWSGTISVADYAKADDEEIPEFETIEEMLEYLQEHQPVIENIWYYPKFGAYSLVDLYSPESKQCELYDYTASYGRRFARNPEAQDQWYDMQNLAGLIDELAAEEVDPDTVDLYLIYLTDSVPQSKLDFWQSCVDSGEYGAAKSSMEEYFWTMAEELMELDGNEDHRANYSLVIEAQDMEALTALAEFCDYSGFDIPVETIRDSKEYLAMPDYDWLEASLNDLVAEFN